MSVEEVGSALLNATCANDASCDSLSNLNVAAAFVSAAEAVAHAEADGPT